MIGADLTTLLFYQEIRASDDLDAVIFFFSCAKSNIFLPFVNTQTSFSIGEVTETLFLISSTKHTMFIFLCVLQILLLFFVLK